ncbi:DNA polymerase/3'-5' exonuclease PolX [Cytobacillus kochii]|uniref:DNA polymerase/3'-5' exonuclease PolX n=1 Tax=Cytobacillus kochii TaxID=859143 RepID=UPI00402AE6D6
MTINKKDVVHLLETIAIYMELKGENPFKTAAFRKAATALETSDLTLDEIEDYTKLPGIGKGTSAVITEFVEEGTTSALDELKKEVPAGLIPLLQLPGLGGKKIAKLYKELGVKNAEDLRTACNDHQVQALAGFGKKTEEKILEALANVGTRPERLPLAFMLPIAEKIEGFLSSFIDIDRFSRAGSIRRMRETIKDLDFIISTTVPASVKEQLLQIGEIKEVIAAGETKVSVVLAEKYDVSVDFRIVTPEEFASTLHHFTGSKDHNVRMRQLAKERGEKISEYGVEDIERGTIKTFQTEEDFYAHFNLPLFPPEIREDGQEVETYTANTPLIENEDIKGDLHMHTTWSDGANSIEEMIAACRTKGYRYMAITDHSQYLKVANGLTKERLLKQKEIIHEINEKYDDFQVLSGIEMDILPDGSLDYEDDVLKEIDIVIASIHSAFSQSEEQIMHRLENAMRNPHVDIIAHPTGRLIGRRDGYAVNIEKLIALAKETNTVLELNANPNRLDLATEALKLAQESDVKIVINTDAHKIETLDHMEVGVSAAKKAWLLKDTVLNTFEADDLLRFLKSRK